MPPQWDHPSPEPRNPLVSVLPTSFNACVPWPGAAAPHPAPRFATSTVPGHRRPQRLRDPDQSPLGAPLPAA